MNEKFPENFKIIIVIPVYNHHKTLKDVVLRTLEIHDTVMVVNDGSTDRSAKAIDGLPIHVIHHTVNQGKGAAILSAAKAARSFGMTHMITIDADGQHDPGDILHFLPYLKTKPLSIIVGKRKLGNTNAPGLSEFGKHFSNFWFRLQTGISLKDTQSGFRAYPLDVFEGLKLREKRFPFETEVLVKAAWAGITFQEVDITVYYPPAEERISHFHVFTDNLQISLLNTRLTMRSMLPVPHRRIFNQDRNCEKISVLHPIRSLKQLLISNASPWHLALSGALGVFLGTLPLISLHTVAILFAAGFFRLNKIAALATSQICMPPIVPALCIETGYFLRHGEFLTDISLETLGHQAIERIYEWLIGSLVAAPAFAVMIGATIYSMAGFTKWAIRENDEK